MRKNDAQKKNAEYWSNPEKYRAQAREYYYHKKTTDPEFIARTRASSKASRARAMALDRDKVVQRETAKHRKKKYGISSSDWQALLEAQDRRCAICRIDHPRRSLGGWATDHCHATGKVRGILCHPCNLALGCASDSAATLRAMALYLEMPR